MDELDYTNRPVPADEGPDTVIRVWEISPHLSDDYDSLLVRGWKAMLDFVRDIAEDRLEGMPDDELADGVTIKVRLREMTRREYDELDCD